MDITHGDPLELSVEPPQYRAHVDRAKAILYCGVRLALLLKRQDGKENLATFRCSAEYSLIYKVQANLTCSDACAMLFAEKNAVFNAWPFFRELCFSQAGKSGLPHVMLPLFRLPINNP
jgi:hypothetical protein